VSSPGTCLRRGIVSVAAALVTLAVLALVAACNESDAPATAAEPTVARVDIVRVRATREVPRIRTFGSLSFRRKADVTIGVEGVLSQMPVEEGDEVRDGQLIARAENVQLEIRMRQAEASLLQANSSLQLAEAQYRDAVTEVDARLLGVERTAIEIDQQERQLGELRKRLVEQERLLEVDGIPESELESTRFSIISAESKLETLRKDREIQMIGLRDQDILDNGFAVPQRASARREILRRINTQTEQAQVEVARARVEAAQAEIASSEALLEQLTITSPLDGVIGARHLEAGERVEPGTQVVTVLADDEVYAVFPVPESDLSVLRKGQEARVFIEALGEERSGTVTVVAPTVDPQTGSVRVRAALSNAGGDLRPGMFATVEVLHGQERETIRIPETAVARKSGGSGSVFTVVNGRAFRREVSFGNQDGDMIEIVSGLEEGDLVIDAPSPLLREGEDVEEIR